MKGALIIENTFFPINKSSIGSDVYGQQFYNFLVNKYDFQTSNITLLQNATYIQILNTIRQVVSRIDYDELWIYYAGPDYLQMIAYDEGHPTDCPLSTHFHVPDGPNIVPSDYKIHGCIKEYEFYNCVCHVKCPTFIFSENIDEKREPTFCPKLGVSATKNVHSPTLGQTVDFLMLQSYQRSICDFQYRFQTTHLNMIQCIKHVNHRSTIHQNSQIYVLSGQRINTETRTFTDLFLNNLEELGIWNVSLNNLILKFQQQNMTIFISSSNDTLSSWLFNSDVIKTATPTTVVRSIFHVAKVQMSRQHNLDRRFKL